MIDNDSPMQRPASSIALCVAGCIHPTLLQDCARRFDFASFPALPEQSFEHTLTYHNGHWQLQSALFPNAKPFYIDFADGKYAYRRAHTSVRAEAIARAIGLKKGLRPRVLDLTAGLGFDAFVLAVLGCHVTMVERSPVMALLLADGLQRLCLDVALAPLRLSCIWSDACAYLARLPETDYPDVIYLDPMYPKPAGKESSALVGQSMRILRSLVGDDMDANALMGAAVGKARLRIVVKRPKAAPYLAEKKPDFSIASKDHRFDVYLQRTSKDDEQSPL